VLNGKKIVVIMPAYNAERTLQKTYDGIPRDIVDDIIVTDDGSRGFKGNVVGLLKNILTTYNSQLTTNLYACGPKEMFYEIKKVLEKYPHINAQVSFEQFMGCGLGVCCGCVIETKSGYKKAIVGIKAGQEIELMPR